MEIKDNLRYRDPKYDYTAQMRNDHILEIFGIWDSHIPPDHTDERQIGNVKVFIVPKGKGKEMFGVNRRVIAQCPSCEKMVCAGHLDQHLKVHKKK